MESGKAHCLVIANNVLSSVENIEEIPAPDGGTVKLLSLCPVQYKLRDDSVSYSLSNRLITTREDNVSASFPLLKDIEVALLRDGDPKNFLSLPAYVSEEKAIGSIIDVSDIGKGVVKLLFKRYMGGGHWAREIWERPVNTVFPLVEGSVVFLNKIRDYGIKISRAASSLVMANEIFVCLPITSYNRKESIVSVQALANRIYDVKETDIVIPNFLLEKRSKSDEIRESPLLSLSSKSTELRIFRPAFDGENELLTHFSTGDLVSVGIENTNFLGTVVEKPCKKNRMYLGVTFCSPRVQDEVVLLDGECGLYVPPQNAASVEPICLAHAGNPVLVKDFEFNGINLSGESGRILLDLNTNQKEVLVEFKKDIGGSSADGMGSPGRCARVPIECIRYVPNRGINASSYLYNGNYITVTPDALEVLSKVPKETITAIQQNWGAKGKIENIIGLVIDIRNNGDALTEPRWPQFLICRDTIVPVECIVALTNKPRNTSAILKTKDLSTLSLKSVQDILDTTPNLTDVQRRALSRLRDSLRREERTQNLNLTPVAPVVETGVHALGADDEDEDNEMEEYDEEDYDEENLDEVEQEYFE